MDGRARRPAEPPFTQTRTIPVRPWAKNFFPFQTFPDLSWALWLNDLARFRNLSQVLSPGFANAGNSAQPQVRFGTWCSLERPAGVRRDLATEAPCPIAMLHTAHVNGYTTGRRGVKPGVKI